MKRSTPKLPNATMPNTIPVPTAVVPNHVMVAVENYLSEIQTIEGEPFEGLNLKLRMTPLLVATKCCLEVLCDKVHDRHNPTGPVTTFRNEPKFTRIYLSSYFITRFPAHIFSNPNGQIETALIESSNQILTEFRAICDSVVQSANHTFEEVPHELTAGFEATLDKYWVTFMAHKTPDKERAIRDIKMALFGLYDAMDQVGGENQDVIAIFITNIEKLQAKLAAYGGAQMLEDFKAGIRTRAVMIGAV